MNSYFPRELENVFWVVFIDDRVILLCPTKINSNAAFFLILNVPMSCQKCVISTKIKLIAAAKLYKILEKLISSFTLTWLYTESC